jgi:hypothetical protein
MCRKRIFRHCGGTTAIVFRVEEREFVICLFFFLLRLSLYPWRWGHHDPPKYKWDQWLRLHHSKGVNNPPFKPRAETNLVSETMRFLECIRRWTKSKDFFFLLVGWDLCYRSYYWPIVPAPDDRWWWLWRNWWNEDWQGKLKYSEETYPSATLSTTNPTWLDPGFWTGAAAVGSQRLTAWAMARPNKYIYYLYIYY